MVDAYLSKKTINVDSVVKIDDWMFLNMGIDKRDYNGDYTNVGDLKQLGIEYLGISEDNIEIKRGLEDLEDLKTNLDAGNPLIVGVYTNMLTNTKRRDVKHFMVLVGIDDEYVYVHDPGKTRGANNKYTIDQFKLAWAGNNYAYIIFKKNDIAPEVVTAENPPQLNSSELVQTEQTQKLSFIRRNLDRLSTFFIQSLRRILGAVPSPEQQEQMMNTSSDVLGTQTEEEDVAEELVFNARFVQREIPVLFVRGAKQVSVSVEVENTGTAVWEKNTVSLNVVGGRAPNAMWYHPSWVTQLRPIVISSVVQPGQKVTVPFTLTIPAVDRRFRLQLVHNVNGSYVQLGDSIATVVLSEVVVPVKEEVMTAPSSTEHKTELSGGDSEYTPPIESLSSTPERAATTEQPSTGVYSGGGGGRSSRDSDDDEEVVTTTPEVSTSTDPTPTSTPTSTDPLPELSDLIITTPVDPLEIVYTNQSEYVLAGTSDEYTETIVVTKDDIVVATTTPSGGMWEIPVIFTTGTQSFVLYGTASEGRQTSSTTIIVVYDAEAPFIDIQLLSVGEGSIVVDLLTYDDSPLEGYEVEFFEVVQSIQEGENCPDELFLFEAPLLQYYLEGDDLYVEFTGTYYGCGFVVDTQLVEEPIASTLYDESYSISVRAKGVDAADNESDWWYSNIPLAFPDPGDVSLEL